MEQEQPQKKRRGNPNWVKGKSGNPGGRPKELKELEALIDEYCFEAVEKIYSLMTTSKSEGIQLRAAEMICDRSLGKPVQAIRHSGSIEHKEVNDHTLDARIDSIVARTSKESGSRTIN